MRNILKATAEFFNLMSIPKKKDALKESQLILRADLGVKICAINNPQAHIYKTHALGTCRSFAALNICMQNCTQKKKSLKAGNFSFY